MPLTQIAQQLRGARLLPLALVFVVAFAALVVSALKLYLLVRTGAPHVRFLGVLHACCVGTFFNNFLPTSIGGDVIKVHRLALQGVPLANAAASVVVDRAAGLLLTFAAGGAVALAWAGLLVRLELSPLRWPLAAVCTGAFVGLAAMYALWRGHVKQWLKSRRSTGLMGRLYAFLESFYLFRNNPGVLVWAFGLSAAFYAAAAANLVLACRAVGASLGAAQAAGVVPLFRLPEMLPISLGGLGVREGALTWCLAHLGPTAAQAAGAALILRFATWLLSAVGGLLYLRAER